MFFASILSGCLLGITSASVIQIRSTDQPLEPIGLGDFKPRCARLNDTRFGDFNSGIQLEKINTIYSFGDSWTDNGNRVGGKPLPPVKPKQSCPFYGGRPTNGKMWTEWLIELVGNGAEVKNYAVSGATVDHEMWKSANKQADMTEEIDRFLCQNEERQFSSSIATLFFGNNDLQASKDESNEMPSLKPAADKFLSETERLIQAGMMNLMVLTPPVNGAKRDEFTAIIWEGLKNFQARYPNLRFITVNLSDLYNAIKSSPRKFGFRSIDSCVPADVNMANVCPDPDYHLYWIKAHPQTYTHRLQAQYIDLIAHSCLSSDKSSPSASQVPRGISDSSKPDERFKPSSDYCKNVDLINHPPKCI